MQQQRSVGRIACGSLVDVRPDEGQDEAGRVIPATAAFFCSTLLPSPNVKSDFYHHAVKIPNSSKEALAVPQLGLGRETNIKPLLETQDVKCSR